jgi:hypothetical protein
MTLIASALSYVESIGLAAAVRNLRAAMFGLDEDTVLQALASEPIAQKATPSETPM